MEFIDALKQGSLADIRKCKKVDLHNHFVLGGSRRYLKEHAGKDIQPIAELYRNGVDVTIGSDDVLIFDSDVSKEYLRLYQCGCLNAEELDDIRINGLK